MRIAPGVVALVSVAGCYTPAARDCSYTCASNGGSCPEGLVCVQGFCRERRNPAETCSFVDSGVVNADAQDPPYVRLVREHAPFAWWRLSDAPGSTIAADEILNANPGMNVGATFGVASFMEGDTAADFVGSELDCITSGDVPQARFAPTSDFTVEAWVNPDTLGGVGDIRQIVTKLGVNASSNEIGWELRTDTGVVHLRLCDGSGTCTQVSGPTFDQDVWTYVVATYHGSTTGHGYMYLNAMQRNDVNVTVKPVASNAHLAIGCSNPAGVAGPSSRFFDGFIDEVALYNRALTAQEITAHYNARQ